MAIETLSREPERITQGETLRWRRELPAFPATDGWVLKYALVHAGGRQLVTAEADGAAHLVEVASATTAAWAAATYAWQAWVELEDGTRAWVGTGQLVVAQDLAAAGAADGVDPRTHAQRVLEAIEAVLEQRASQAQLGYTIGTDHGSRQLAYIPHAELLALRDRYRLEVQQEQRAARVAAGLGHAGRVVVRFGGW